MFKLSYIDLKNHKIYIVFFLSAICLVIANAIKTQGTILTGDSAAYFHLFESIEMGHFPSSDLHVPGVSYLLFLIYKVSGLYDYALFNIMCFCLLLINCFLIFRITFFVDSFFAKIVLCSILFLPFIIRIEISAHADALFLTGLLLYFYLISIISERLVVSDFVLLGVLSGLLCWIKYNNFVLLPITIVWLACFSSFFQWIKHSLVYFICAFTVILIWIFLNGSVIHHLSGNINFNIIFEAVKVNCFDMGNVLARALLTKAFIFKDDYLNSLAGFVLLTAILGTGFFLRKKFIGRKRRLLYFTLLFTLLYPLILIALLSKSGHIEIDRRTLFPLVLAVFLLLAQIIDQFFVSGVMIAIIAGFLLLHWYTAAGFIRNYISSPSQATVNSVRDNKVLVGSFFAQIQLDCSRYAIATDDPNELVFYLDCDSVISMPYSNLKPKVNMRVAPKSIGFKDSLRYFDKFHNKRRVLVFHHFNSKDTLWIRHPYFNTLKQVFDLNGLKIYAD